MIEIIHIENDESLELVRIIWREYADFLKNALSEYKDRTTFIEYFENYEQEIAHNLPGRFGPPYGCLLLAKYRGKPAGCVGLLNLGDNICEMRRIFVRPEYRGLGTGKALAQAAIEQGRKRSYSSIRLNTNRRMPEAEKLYRSLGFTDIAPYEEFETDGMVFLELKL